MPDTLDTLPREFKRSFVPEGLKLSKFEDIEPLLKRLLEADISTVERLEAWLLQASELSAVIDEHGSRVHIRTTVDTTNPEYKKAFLDYIENFDPKLKPVFEQLNRKFKESPARAKLDKSRYGVLERSILNRLALFRPENIPLETEESKLEQRYDEIMGSVVIKFEGEERTPQQMGKFQLEPDRALRERAFRASMEARLKKSDEIDELYEKLVRIREKKARNAGFANYREFQWLRRERFDYTPAHCEAYHRAVDEVVLPVLKRIARRRREMLGVPSLRPWDMACDPEGKPALKPFGQVEQLQEGCSRIFHKVEPELGSQFDLMRRLSLLDLANRKGKAPGGYQSTLSEVRLPFIFMNAVGVDDDVRTLLHEGGHAFHALAARNEPLNDYRGAPIEFCEVASMSMELLGNPYLGEFYTGEDLKRARRDFYEDLLMFLPWFATIDAFQHWVYTHEGHTHDQRVRAWLEVFRRFNPLADWSGLEDFERIRWQQQGHLFGAPFYYIEYAIAQLGALQVWLNAKKDRKKAIGQYRAALALGGSRPLPELFATAGAKFDFGPETVKPLVEEIEKELEAIG